METQKKFSFLELFSSLLVALILFRSRALSLAAELFFFRMRLSFSLSELNGCVGQNKEDAGFFCV